MKVRSDVLSQLPRSMRLEMALPQTDPAVHSDQLVLPILQGWLHFHFSLSCIGEGNDYPLQCSCLENPRDRGAWWAAIYGVAQSRTRLKRFSSSSSSSGVYGKWILLSASHEQALYFRVLWSLLILRRINPVRIINAHFTDKKTKAWGFCYRSQERELEGEGSGQLIKTLYLGFEIWWDRQTRWDLCVNGRPRGDWNQKTKL